MVANKELLPISQIIKLATERGVDFGSGNPENRIRYLVKFGLLPHAKRRSFNGAPPSAAFKLEVVDRIVQIEKLQRRGKSVPEQKQLLLEVKTPKKLYAPSRTQTFSKPVETTRPNNKWLNYSLAATAFVAILLLTSLAANLLIVSTNDSQVLGAQTKDENLLVKVGKALVWPIAKVNLALLKTLKNEQDIDPLNITNIQNDLEKNSDGVLSAQNLAIKNLQVERVSGHEISFTDLGSDCFLTLNSNKLLTCSDEFLNNAQIKAEIEKTTQEAISQLDLSSINNSTTLVSSTLAFKNFLVSGQSTISASSSSDSITFIAGSNITLGTNSITKAITINSTAVGGGGGSGGDATTLDTFDSSQFLRSDSGDNYTVGTLTFDAGTTLSILGTFSCTDCVGDGAIPNTITVAASGITGSLSDGQISDTLTASNLVAVSSVVADGEVDDNLTIDGTGNVNWAALSSYPAACGAGTAITALADSPTCSAFLTSVTFADIATGTNTNALLIGTGGSLGVTGSGTITATNLAAGSSVVADSEVDDNITVDWSGLQNYPGGCSAGNAITTLADTPTCTAFARAGSAETITGAWSFDNLSIADTAIVLSGGSSGLDLQAGATTTLSIYNSTVGQVADLQVEGLGGFGSYVQASDLRSNGSIYVNYDGADGSSFLYFYEGASATGESLSWNDASAQFELSDDLNVSDNLFVVGGDIVGTNNTAMDIGEYVAGDITFGNIAAATNDYLVIRPFAGGAANFKGIFTSLDLTADRTWTFPDEGGTICTNTSVCSIYSPVAGSSSITTVGALSSGSISSGFGSIDVGADNIIGATLNGTTGINTGTGAGTNRIDSLGNLVNIGSITSSGGANTYFLSSTSTSGNIFYVDAAYLSITSGTANVGSFFANHNPSAGGSTARVNSLAVDFSAVGTNSQPVNIITGLAIGTGATGLSSTNVLGDNTAGADVVWMRGVDISATIGYAIASLAAEVTNYAGIYIQDPNLYATGTVVVTNPYGIYIEDFVDADGFTNTPKAIYQAGTDDYNILGGSTRIGGTSNPTVSLDVTSPTSNTGVLKLTSPAISSGTVSIADIIGVTPSGGTENFICIGQSANCGAITGGAGAINAINIASITAGAGAETAVSIGTGWDTDIKLQNAETIDNKVNGDINLNDGDGTNLISVSKTNLWLNLDNTTTYTQRLCHSGGDGATGVVDIGDCQAAGQADFAEYYGTDGSLEAGDVVIVDSSKPAEHINDPELGFVSKSWVKAASIPYQYSLIGVVSTNPYTEILGQGVFHDNEHPKPIALSGRVPVKISTENGDISPGDPLTSSSTPGVAMKATQSGTIIGKALESFSGPGQGKVLVFVQNSYYVNFDEAPNYTLQNSAGYLTDIISKTGEAVFSKVTSTIASFGKLIFGELVVDKTAKSAGQSTLPVGQSEVLIKSDKVNVDSLINLTPDSEPDGLLYVKEKKPGEGFIVGVKRIDQNSAKEIKFNWFILNQE